MEISKKLYLLRTENNLTQSEFAKIAHSTDKSISAWENGTRSPKLQSIKPICDYFGIDFNTFADESNDVYKAEQVALKSSLMGHIDIGKTKAIKFPKRDEADDIADRYRKLDDHGKGAVKAILSFEEASAIAEKRQHKPVKPRSDGFVDVKVFDQVSAAGLGNYLDDPVYHMEQYPANEVPEGTEFGVRISGVSMSPKIPDGATAFVQSRSTIEPGKIGIFLVNDESFCKKLVVDRDRREIRLASFNPDYKDRVIEDADVFSTMGLVLGWWPHG